MEKKKINLALAVGLWYKFLPQHASCWQFRIRLNLKHKVMES